MKKVAINTCFGGFGLSLKAQKILWELKGFNDIYFYKSIYINSDNIEYTKIKDIAKSENEMFIYCLKKDYGDFVNSKDVLKEDFLFEYDIYKNREDKDLITVIEMLKSEASGKFSSLKAIEIPDNIEYEIEDYDGIETIHEIHKSWY